MTRAYRSGRIAGCALVCALWLSVPPAFAGGKAKPADAGTQAVIAAAARPDAPPKPPAVPDKNGAPAANDKTGAVAGTGQVFNVPRKSVPPASANSDSAIKPRVTESQKDFCNLVWGCGLIVPPGYCPDPVFVEKPRFTFDSTRCQEARTLNARGVGPGHPLYGFNLYRFLGMEYRVLYTVEDELPISQERLAYLLADLPLAAHLVSHFMNEPYTAEYIDGAHTHFKGTKGKRLRGDATLISGSSDEKHLFYFGYGVATVAWWTLKGPALMDFSYYPKPDNGKVLKYRMKLLVFPGNGVINSIMNLGLFKKVVLGKVREVLQDITGTATKLAAGGSKDILAGKDWTAEEKAKIDVFLKLP